MNTHNVLLKGLNTDVAPNYQEEGTYRFALNAVLESELGELRFLSNEKGNIFCGDNLPENKVIIGHVLTDNDEVVLFFYDSAGQHEIGILNSNTCLYTELAIDTCLNFSDKYPINALFRIRNGCEKIIYFTDNLNPYRVINLTDTSYWLDGTDIIDCNRIQLYKDHNIPCISLFQGEGDIGVKDSGGNLLNGVYYFFIRYLDPELNPTNWILGTRPVAIGDETFEYTQDAGTTNLYDGGSNVLTSPYYVNPSNKSISLQLTSLDNDTFNFYQLAVVKRTGDAGEISGVDVLYPEPFQSTSDVFVYTNADSQVQTQTTLDDLLSIIQPIDRVKTHAQDDNRLFLGGTTTDTYDWSTFQRYASKIKTEWIKDPSTSPVDTFVKQPQYYFTTASFMEDEIYALGIVYVMEDGSLSPVFHIPGRPIDVVTGTNPLIGSVSGVADDGEAWDSGELTNYGTGLPSSKTKRWQQISTAAKNGANTSRGLMGYHEATSATYPDITACDGESYWGNDWQGNPIEAAVTKIRHHRMPPAHLYANAFSTAPASQVGILFTNVEYPPGAVKHYFVYGDRTFERSILAKGLMIPLYTTDDKDPGGFYPGTGDDYLYMPLSLRPISVAINPSPKNVLTYAFICSEGLLKDKAYSPRYFQLERYLTDVEVGLGFGANNVDVETVNIEQYGTSLNVSSFLYHFNSATYPTSTVNYSIVSTFKLPKATYGTKTGPIIYNPTDINVQNLSFNTSPIIVVLEDQPEEWVNDGNTPDDAFFYGSLKVDVDPFTELSAIQYKRMGNCALTAASTGSLFQSYSGDTFVGRVNLTDYAYYQEDSDKSVTFINIAFPTQDTAINYEFRHGAFDPVYSYFQWNYQYAPAGHELVRNYIASKYYEETDDVMELYPQNADYNDSYSYLQSLETYLPIPFNYEYCKDCLEAFPYRIYYSEQDSSENQADGYRIFRPNNYRDLPGETGYLTDLFVNFEQLYARTTNSIYHVPTRPQQLQSDESSIYIGTGEVLSLPAKQLKTSENAFGGGNFFKARTTTEYGSVYVDDISGRVFLLTNQLNDLSNLGLRNYFQNNGRVAFLSEFFGSTGTEFPFLSTSSPSGVGYISWYDPRYKRLFVHKRDFSLVPVYNLTYEVTESDEVPLSLDNYEVRFNGHSFYTDINGTPSAITFDNSDFFENKSFTLSYSFLTNRWISFHSYLPKYAFGAHRDFFTFSNWLYKHNEGPYTTYYLTKYPHIVDLSVVAHPTEAKVFNNIIYNSYTTIYDEGSQSYISADETYDSYIAYNSNQTTGKVSLIPKTSPFDTANTNLEAIVGKTDKQYRISNIRDHTISNNIPIWTSDWSQVQSEYFIDKVPYPYNVDPNLSPFEARRLRDRYMGLRLFFKPDNNYKISTDIISTKWANRNR